MLATANQLAESSQQELATAQDRSTYIVMLMIFMLVGMTAGHVWIIGRRIVRPVARLQSGIRIIGSGNLEHRVAIATRDEIGEFSRVLDQMARDLAAITISRDELEQRVKERTVELSNANAELIRADRLKDRFLANMSHELRSPLNVILGMAEALQEQVYGDLNADVLRYVRRIEESGRYLLQLINDMLDLSRIRAGKMVLDITPVSVNSVCRASLALTTPLIKKKRITVQTTYGVEICQADALRLKQILVNLLNNAVKFTPEGGSVGLEAHDDPEKRAVTFTVWDTGIGIDSDSLSHIFDPFVQLDNRLARQYSGAGLGLALVYRLVQLHGGSITVESDAEKGSRFIVSLPQNSPYSSRVDTPAENLSQDAAGPIAPHKPQPEDHDPESPLILIAEDQEANLQILSEYLTLKGFRTIVVQTGKEALEYAQKTHPDVILMDIRLPEIDGLEAIRRIRADSAIAAIPIIAVTALVMPGIRESCFSAGADEYLSKPVSLRNLHVSIERLLSSEDKTLDSRNAR